MLPLLLPPVVFSLSKNPEATALCLLNPCMWLLYTCFWLHVSLDLLSLTMWQCLGKPTHAEFPSTVGHLLEAMLSVCNSFSTFILPLCGQRHTDCVKQLFVLIVQIWVAEPSRREDLCMLVLAYLQGSVPHPPVDSAVNFYQAAKAATVSLVPPPFTPSRPLMPA